VSPLQLQALADLVLPGDETGLPPGSYISDVMDVLERSTSPIKALLASHPEFADAGKRRNLLGTLETIHPQEFRDFVLGLLKAYYETGQVLEALGWRSAPPQPQGHVVAPMDEGLASSLARIAERRRLWR
jgi:hypothetical protein